MKGRVRRSEVARWNCKTFIIKHDCVAVWCLATERTFLVCWRLEPSLCVVNEFLTLGHAIQCLVPWWITPFETCLRAIYAAFGIIRLEPHKEVVYPTCCALCNVAHFRSLAFLLKDVR